jgi:hypothetical protein
MVNLPNFTLRRLKTKNIEFIAAEKAFKPQRMIRMRQDVNGWVSREDRRKWSLSYGKEYAIDEDKAREFCIKGYANPVGWEVNASDDERAEVLSNVTIIGLGG